MIMKPYKEYAFNEQDRGEFRDGRKVIEWSRKYPFLFDSEDVRIAKTQASRGYHFFEWFAAICLYEEIGYFSLVEKYAYKIHAKKRKTLQSLVPPSVFEFVIKSKDYGYGGLQAPDLLVYKPDLSDWFFCEVKGLQDRLSKNQIKFFQALDERSGVPVRYIHVSAH
jgi:hypothetical protein